MVFMSFPLPYHLYALGDSAITIEWSNKIDPLINEEVIARFREFRENPLPGTKALVPAYSSLTVYFDMATVKLKTLPYETAYDCIRNEIVLRLEVPVKKRNENTRLIRIPVCYELPFAPDLTEAAKLKDLSTEELILLHSAKIYRVYMIGFLPGFAYMGEVDERISLPRKPQPVPTVAGSVGIAGRQTGIYPLDSPGGWQIIGKTPLKMFDPKRKEPSLLRAGDEVEFFRVSAEEFHQLKTEY